jgi:hypothetical protein
MALLATYQKARCGDDSRPMVRVCSSGSGPIYLSHGSWTNAKALADPENHQRHIIVLRSASGKRLRGGQDSPNCL